MSKYWYYQLLNWLIHPFCRRVFIMEGRLIIYNYLILPGYRIHEFRYDANCRTFNASMTCYELAVRKLQIELYDYTLNLNTNGN